MHRAVPLWDMRDAEAFIRAAINKSGLARTPDDWDELVAEGLLILSEMAAKYQPRMAGHDRDGSFTGYASMFFPRKLRGAWHRMHEHHQVRTNPDGSRRYVFHDPPKSLDEHTEDDDELDTERIRTPGNFVSA